MDDQPLLALRDIAAGFDTHDLDRIMRHFAPDAVFEAPRGPDRWGQRFEGREAVARLPRAIRGHSGRPLPR